MDVVLRKSAAEGSGTPSACTVSDAATPETTGALTESADASTPSRDDTSAALTDGATSSSDTDWFALGETVCDTTNDTDDDCMRRRPAPLVSTVTEQLLPASLPHTDVCMASATCSAVRPAGTVASSDDWTVRATSTEEVVSEEAA